MTRTSRPTSSCSSVSSPRDERPDGRSGPVRLPKCMQPPMHAAHKRMLSTMSLPKCMAWPMSFTTSVPMSTVPHADAIFT